MVIKNNVDILKQKLLYSASKYSDYSRYNAQLAQLDEDYDETLELNNFDIWINNSGGTIRDKAANMLRVTLDIFEDLRDNAEQELYFVMNEIMELDELSQLSIYNVVINKDLFTKKHFDEMISEWYDYPYEQQEALDSFLSLLKEYIDESNALDNE